MAKILVVDDDPMTLELYREALSGAGRQVITAVDGAEALVRMGEAPVLIVADLITPRLDGYAFIKRLRESTTDAKTPIIVVSASATGEWSIKVGADRFLRKPVDLGELRAAVDELLAAPRGTPG